MRSPRNDQSPGNNYEESSYHQQDQNSVFVQNRQKVVLLNKNEQQTQKKNQLNSILQSILSSETNRPGGQIQNAKSNRTKTNVSTSQNRSKHFDGQNYQSGNLGPGIISRTQDQRVDNNEQIKQKTNKYLKPKDQFFFQGDQGYSQGSTLQYWAGQDNQSIQPMIRQVAKVLNQGKKSQMLKAYGKSKKANTGKQTPSGSGSTNTRTQQNSGTLNDISFNLNYLRKDRMQNQVVQQPANPRNQSLKSSYMSRIGGEDPKNIKIVNINNFVDQIMINDINLMQQSKKKSKNSKAYYTSINSPATELSNHQTVKTYDKGSYTYQEKMIYPRYY